MNYENIEKKYAPYKELKIDLEELEKKIINKIPVKLNNFHKHLYIIKNVVKNQQKKNLIIFLIKKLEKRMIVKKYYLIIKLNQLIKNVIIIIN